MWGFVWVLHPDNLMRFADRGPNHTVKFHSSHHDFPCDEIPNGMRSVDQVVRQENEKARRLFAVVSERTDNLAEKFPMVAHRLVDMLPYIENNMIVQLGSPVLSLPVPSGSWSRFQDTTSFFDVETAYSEQQQRHSNAKGGFITLVRSLHLVRCLRDLGRQRLSSHSHCVDKIFMYVGRAALLPRISGFVYDEVAAPAVTQEVSHPDPPATIDEQLASLNLEHKFADNVIVLNEADPGAVINEPETEPIHLLEYNRHPEAFLKALSEGEPLRKCRAALEGAGRKWLLGSGAKVFVHPSQYAQALVAIVEQGIDLRPFHVIVAESFEYHVEACLTDLSYRQGARIKKRRVIDEAPVVGDSGKAAEEASSAPEMDVDTEEDGFPLVEKKTFICMVPRLRNPQSVTQSTTEAHSGGVNPRRICVVALSD